MASPRTYSSDEEWCLLSDEDNEVEPEPELVPRYTSAVSALNTKSTQGDAATTVESAQVLALLSETSQAKERDERREAAYSRAVRLSLLSTEHRDRLQGTPQAPVAVASHGAISVKVAFGAWAASTTKKRSFPDRLRDTVKGFRASETGTETNTPTFTPVAAFVQDQATQTDSLTWEPVGSTVSVPDVSRVGLFRAALDRTFTLSTQLHGKSQECERLSLRVVELEQRQTGVEYRQEDGDGKLTACRRSLAIANERLALGLEYQTRLRGKVAVLTDENDGLKRQKAVLSGQESDVSSQSVLELEAIEDALAAAMTNVRAALRAQYRSAIHKAETVDAQTGDEGSERCVVCLAQAASVKTAPCGHQVLCPACAVRLDVCPVDRLPIQDKTLAFGLNAYHSA